GLLLWLYKFEMRLVRGGVALALLSLRALVLVIVLGLVLLQPVLVHTRTENLPGRVLVAVDRSGSMDVADPQRPVADKLRLARALRLNRETGGLPTEAQLDSWIKQHQEGRPIQWVADHEHPGDPERRRRLAEEYRTLHDALCRKVDLL